MAYWKGKSKNTRPLDSFGVATNHTTGVGGGSEYHELEFGVVLDIVLDLKHPIYTGGNPQQTNIDTKRWPSDLTGNAALNRDPDLSWIGRALVRPVISGQIIEKDQLRWAYPLENNFSEYPLLNETVVLYEQNEKLYYSRKVNCQNWPNNNLDFTIESGVSGQSNMQLFTNMPFTGRIETQTDYESDSGYHGYAGKYFFGSPKMRTLHRFEGDLLMESRFGSEILMKAFDKNRANDVGDIRYPDYANSGNPMIIIRNRQRQLLKVGQTLTLKHSPNPGTIVGTVEEKNVGGYLDENINHDGTSIYITSGLTVSEWVTTCFKRMFADTKGEEVAAFQGQSSFTYPKLNGDQLIINSDRLILSSRYAETFHYSKKRYAIVTDSEYTVDSHDQQVFTTHVKTVFNSPAIYLGEYDQTAEPALLGQTTVNWLYAMCNWMLAHTHWYHHSHPNAGKESPSKTQMPVEVQQLMTLRDNLQACLSRRVFLTGGGYAPGQNGVKIGK